MRARSIAAITASACVACHGGVTPAPRSSAPIAPSAAPALAPPALPTGWSETMAQADPAAEHLAKSVILEAADLPWEPINAYARRKFVSSGRATFAVLEIRRSDQPHDLRHWHMQDQISYVVDGVVEVVVGTRVRRIGPGSIYVCEPNVPHSIRVLSERATIVDVFAPAREDFTRGLAASLELPEPRSNPAIVASGDAVYVVGGNDEHGATRTVWKLDVRPDGSGTWSKLPDLRGARFGHGALFHGGRLWVVGGAVVVDGKETATASVESWGPSEATFRSELPMPSPRARFAIAEVAGRALLFGGSDASGRAVDTSIEYDFTTGRWRPRARLPLAATRLAAVASSARGTVFVLGGEGPDGGALGTVHEFDPEADRYTPRAPLAHARKNFAASAVMDRVIVSGGWDTAGRERRFLRSSEVFDPEAGRWMPGPDLPAGRDGVRSVSVPGAADVLAIGGYDGVIRRAIDRLPVAKTERWRIDKEMKFHLAWLPPDTPGPAESATDDPPPLGFAPRWAPDISNIALAGIRGLGFPIPNRPSPELHQLYLKFFAYPEKLDARTSVDGVLRPLILDRIPGADLLARFVSDTRNVVVKRAWIAPKTFPFSADKPFPPIRIRPSAHAQADFDAHVPFSSIYVEPDSGAVGRDGAATRAGARSADAEAEATTRGVFAFHRELLQTYEQSLTEIHGPEPHKLRYFLAGTPCAPPPASCVITILRVPRAPMIFRNWRELPMPQDPKHVFLTGLLLVYKDELAMVPGAPLVERVATALARAATDRAHVFEVGSVVRLPDSATSF